MFIKSDFLEKSRQKLDFGLFLRVFFGDQSEMTKKLIKLKKNRKLLSFLIKKRKKMPNNQMIHV